MTESRHNPPSVCAVIITYNRREYVRRVVESVLVQNRPVDEVILVDNHSTDGTGEMIRKAFPQVIYMDMQDNLGSAGGMAAGIKAAYEKGHDYIWLWEDDTPPQSEALQKCLEVFNADPEGNIGIVHAWGSIKGKPTPRAAIWQGRYKAVKPKNDQEVYDVDVVCNTGNLVARKTIDLAGLPRSDYFMMWSEIAYGINVRSKGLRIVALPQVLYEHIKPDDGGAPAPWRGYYQTRNQLAHALERGSSREVLWWAERQVKFTIHLLLHYDRKLLRLRLRILGAWHGLRGKLGRTIDPANYVQVKR